MLSAGVGSWTYIWWNQLVNCGLWRSSLYCHLKDAPPSDTTADSGVTLPWDTDTRRRRRTTDCVNTLSVWWIIWQIHQPIYLSICRPLFLCSKADMPSGGLHSAQTRNMMTERHPAGRQTRGPDSNSPTDEPRSYNNVYTSCVGRTCCCRRNKSTLICKQSRYVNNTYGLMIVFWYAPCIYWHRECY